MGSKVFDGVRFAAYPEDHEPPHVHGTIADVILILNLLPDGTIVLSDREDAIAPSNAKRNVQAQIRKVASEHVDDLVALWEKAHGK